MKKVSLKDIATAAGVSTALVSYVLTNKEKEARIGEEMAKKIREIARQLNYQPNHIARSLKSGRSFTIGLVMADISNAFFANIARTIEDEAKRNNYTVIFGSSDENVDKSQDLINVLLNRQVDGLIITPTEGSEKQIAWLQEQHVPFVLIDRFFPGINANHIAVNNFESAYQAVTHLVKAGRKRIGMIAYETTLHHIAERKRGYLEAMRDHRVPDAEKRLKTARYSHLKTDIRTAIDQLCTGPDRADAIFFATNSLAIEGLKYINELRIRVPDILAIIAFDEGEAFDLFYSPVTYIQQPILQMGKEAVRVLLEQIKDQQKTVENIFIDTTLVVRQSCGSKR
ncbi:LacI family transcriptional regulator [Chitinophaga terrae (ex Kim and Jung 2007)]|uniref:LacI family DNA-binding transcriptional regulator n=1 Tax=Chitinophaga terrae (ex Kim and Jung 2007) TaxID=408074 RepID=UPI00277FBDEC|nr:substrate-binding domain-containing protein [Chitinophaga terrae (ex Kim and Jung 2007)]MDQ0109058.1 LacI family transcriptional regulator [Chitinophaga terrae (ex Kim and Jung 2007)]